MIYLVDKVALDDEESADDAAGSHPKGVRNSRLLLVNVPVDGVDSLQIKNKRCEKRQ